MFFTNLDRASLEHYDVMILSAMKKVTSVVKLRTKMLNILIFACAKQGLERSVTKLALVCFYLLVQHSQNSPRTSNTLTY